MVLGLYFPQFLDADTEFLDVTILRQLELLDQLLGKRAAHAFTDQRIFAQERHAAGVIRAGLAVLLDAHVAGRYADNVACIVIKHFACGKARIDLDTEFLRLGRKPPTDIAERDDVLAVIVHQRRHGEVRQADGACWP
ncbi:hypothetical protein D3C73_539850 [compost metagenome]